MLEFLSTQTPVTLWLIFLAENLVVTGIALFAGWLTLKLSRKPIHSASAKEIFSCLGTNLVNTGITYLGFWLWQHGFIGFKLSADWMIIPDVILLLLGMDLAMYVFHYAIHYSVVYKPIHRFHHHYNNPIPIDLFVLHPLETVGFGALWLILLSAYTFNFYSVIIYLTLNVMFGIAGHLGIEPVSAKARNSILLKYVGTSSFHHTHHSDVNYNFGFYTNIWDRLFNTYKP